MEGLAVAFLFLGCLNFFGVKKTYHRLRGVVYLLLSCVFYMENKEKTSFAEHDQSLLFLAVVTFIFIFGALYMFLSTLESGNVEDLNDFDD